MDRVLPGGTRIWNRRKYIVSGQHERVVIGKEQEEIFYKKKRINVRYYFIKDWLETGDVVIEHFLTEKMLGDHFIKPLQGALFKKCRL